MRKSIIEKVLGTSNPYSARYLDATLALTKSFTVVSKREASSYNDLVLLNYRKVANQFDKTNWRYYRHLAGEYHEVDVPMKIISRDNRKEIILTREVLEVHIETREALCAYGAFYDEVVLAYPEQELLLKSMIASNDRMTIKEIIDSPDWTIISYNEDLVEEQETDLIVKLQQRIYNYSVKNLLTNYSIVENLFMAVLFTQLYNFIYLTILSLRLMNIKSNKVHSYHLLSYLASHHGLDIAMEFLDNSQRMFLYRNLLYLQSHAGREDTFETLIEKFFDPKNIVLTNYTLKQKDELREDLSTDYVYIQKLLNKKNFIHSRDDFTYEDLASKEMQILPNNYDTYKYGIKEIDFTVLNTLTSRTNTKDLEAKLQDDSNNVPYKLLDTLIDYWGVTTHLGYNESLIVFQDPVSGMEIPLTSKEAYTLFVITIMMSMGVDMATEVIPDVVVWRALREEQFDDEFLFSRLQSPNPLTKKIVSRINTQVPRYNYMMTRRAFKLFVDKVYKFNLGMWIYISSTGELITSTDVTKSYNNMHRQYFLDHEGETVGDFLTKLDITQILKYSKEQILDFSTELLHRASDDILKDMELNRLTQESVLYIFNKFKSYSTQTLSNVEVNNDYLLGLKPPKWTITKDQSGNTYRIPTKNEFNCFRWGDGEEYEDRSDVQVSITGSEGYMYDVKEDVSFVVGSTCVDQFILRDGTTIGFDEELTTPNSVLTKEDLIKFREVN